MSVVGISAWAADEVLRGVNLFRRALGLAVLVAEVLRLASTRAL